MLKGRFYVKSQEEAESPRDHLGMGTSVVLVSKVDEVVCSAQGGTG